MIDIIIPTKKVASTFNDCLNSLAYIPFPFNVHLIEEGNNWAHAVNIGLSRTKNDVIIMDDDVILLPNTFDPDPVYQIYGDMIGFTLVHTNGVIHHAGTIITPTSLTQSNKVLTEPTRMPHVTTSLVIIKRKVIDTIGGFTEMSGHSFEDVDYSFRVWEAGFTVVCLPNVAIHWESLTKKNMKNHLEKLQLNWSILGEKWFKNMEFLGRMDKRGLLSYD